MRNYCDVVDVENYLLTEVAEYFEPQVQSWIAGVSRIFDRMANRKLVADVLTEEDVREIKYYDGNNRTDLSIDDAVEITEVQVNDAVAVVTNYPKVAPHRKVISTAGFPYGVQNISVQGNFGMFADIPDDLRLACAVVVAGIIDANEGKIGIKSESIGGTYSVTYGDAKGIADYEQAIATVERYKKIVF